MKTQVNVLSDPTPSTGDLINQWFMVRIMGLLLEKIVTYFGNHYFDLCFLLHVPLLLLWYLPPGPPDNHLMNHLQASGRRLTAQGT